MKTRNIIRLRRILHQDCIICLRTAINRYLTFLRTLRSISTNSITAVNLRLTRSRRFLFSLRFLFLFLKLWIMERDFREAIGDMPYHRRHDGLSAIKVFEMEQLAAFLNDLITRADNLPLGRAKVFFLLVVLLLFQAMLLFGSVERRNLVPLNRENKTA